MFLTIASAPLAVLYDLVEIAGADTFCNVAYRTFASQAIRKASEIGWKPLHFLFMFLNQFQPCIWERDGGDAGEWTCASGASDRGLPTESAVWSLFGAEEGCVAPNCPACCARTGAGTGGGDVAASVGGTTEGEGAAGAIAIGATAADRGALGGEKLGSEEIGAVFGGS
jgi:hypothetical protein